MPVNRCPHCKQRYVVDMHCSDYVHTCNSGNQTLDQEDKFVASTSVYAGVENKLFGTNAGIAGARGHTRTSRGNKVTTHVTRQRQVYIDLKNGLYSENPR